MASSNYLKEQETDYLQPLMADDVDALSGMFQETVVVSKKRSFVTVAHENENCMDDHDHIEVDQPVATKRRRLITSEPFHFKDVATRAEMTKVNRAEQNPQDHSATTPTGSNVKPTPPPSSPIQPKFHKNQQVYYIKKDNRHFNKLVTITRVIKDEGGGTPFYDIKVDGAVSDLTHQTLEEYLSETPIQDDAAKFAQFLSEGKVECVGLDSQQSPDNFIRAVGHDSSEKGMSYSGYTLTALMKSGNASTWTRIFCDGLESLEVVKKLHGAGKIEDDITKRDRLIQEERVLFLSPGDEASEEEKKKKKKNQHRKNKKREEKVEDDYVFADYVYMRLVTDRSGNGSTEMKILCKDIEAFELMERIYIDPDL